MRKIDLDDIIIGEQHALENTWGNKYNTVIPDFKMEGNVLKFTSQGIISTINQFDEIILTILIKYLFISEWFFKQCYGFGTNNSSFADDKIKEYVKIGLCWKQDIGNTTYLRPTYALFNLFGLKPIKYSPIPYNLLTHTTSEQKIMFDVMSGNATYLNYDELLPRVSSIGFGTIRKGTNIITEGDFRNPTLFRNDKIKDIEQMEFEMNQAINAEERITPELRDYRKFNIVKKTSNTGTIKDYQFHIPDLIIPNLRNKGKPTSIALEAELSNKRTKGYEESLSRYKDNNRFGTVIYLCGDSGIAEGLRAAFKNIGGCGKTKLVLQEFVIPHI